MKQPHPTLFDLISLQGMLMSLVLINHIIYLYFNIVHFKFK